MNIESVSTFLIVETSGDDSFLALCTDEDCIDAFFLPPKGQSTVILSSTKKLLEKHVLTLNELKFIAVGTGPGSFTGTRVGVMLVKTLGFASHIPLVPFCSLARFTPSESGSFLTIVDGKSSGFFCLEGKKEGKEVAFTKHPFILASNHPTLDSKKDFIMSSDQAKVKASFPQLLPEKSWEPPTLSLTSLAKRVHEQYESGMTATHSQVTVTYLN